MLAVTAMAVFDKPGLAGEPSFTTARFAVYEPVPPG
jgi:hypothetical protein